MYLQSYYLVYSQYIDRGFGRPLTTRPCLVGHLNSLFTAHILFRFCNRNSLIVIFQKMLNILSDSIQKKKIGKRWMVDNKKRSLGTFNHIFHHSQQKQRHLGGFTDAQAVKARAIQGLFSLYSLTKKTRNNTRTQPQSIYRVSSPVGAEERGQGGEGGWNINEEEREQEERYGAATP